METIVIGQLGAKGDCVFATPLAAQIRHDYPDCHLVWAVSSACKDILRNNPHVDEIWEVPVDSHMGTAQAWPFLADEVKELVARGHVDRCVLSQINPGNFQNYDGTIRPSILRAYGRPMTVPVRGHVVLDAEEEDNVRRFVDAHDINRYRHRVLFECTSKSGQSNMNVAHALRAAESVISEVRDCCVILSTDAPLASEKSNIISAKSVTFRENLALIRHCTLFVGCGSGITALVTTCVDSYTLPTVQILAAGTSVYSSIAHEFAHRGLDPSPFLETRDPEPDETAAIIIALLKGDRAAAASMCRPDTAPFFASYIQSITRNLLEHGKIIDAAYSLFAVVERYGWQRELMEPATFIPRTAPIHAPFLRTFRKNFTKAMMAFKK